MKSPSLRLRLTLFISGILFLACCVTTSVSYFELKGSLKQVLDSQQLLFAKRLAALNMQHGRMMKKSALVDIDSSTLAELDYDDDALAFAIFNRKGEMILSDGEEGKKFYFQGGFFPTKKNRAIVNDNDGWRILWLLSNDNHSIIAVGQKLDYQQDILISLLIKQLIPWLITFVIVIMVVIILISRGFYPINLLAEKIALRKSDDASAINLSGVPKEVTPFVLALNNLFARISLTMTRERQFISDAAHELRTPLAALRVQTEVAQLHNDDEDEAVRLRALDNLLLGIDRTSHLVDQLLTLSRLDTIENQNQVEPLYWIDIINHVIVELTPFLAKKQIQYEIYQNSVDESIEGHALLLSILVSNLVNNAIRYIPEHSTIFITIDNKSLTVADNGPGVGEEELARLGERFYRPAGQNEQGSGLGLSIVKKIAQLHNISLQFSNREEGGFQVSLNY